MVTNIVLAILAASVIIDVIAYFVGVTRFGWAWPIRIIKNALRYYSQ